MPVLTCRYSGVCWYFANVSCHCASDSGGSVPTIGCHSTIDRPECVSRVDAADDDHREHQRAADEEPRGHATVCCAAARMRRAAAGGVHGRT